MKHTHAFIATSPCGCVDSIAIDDGRSDADVLEWIRDGSAVQRLPRDEAKARFVAGTPEGGDCPHTPKWGRSS